MALAILLMLFAINGVLSLAEIAILSSKKVLLRQEAEAGNLRAAAALALAEDPTRLLSTAQAGITMIAVITGMVGEAALSDDLRVWLERFDFMRTYSHASASGITVVGITYMALVLGELVPKRIAISNPERFAKATALPMMLLARVCGPVVSFLSFSTDLLSKPFGRAAGRPEKVTEEEVRGIIQQAAEEGVLHAAEHQLVERVLRLGDRQVRNLMVPRTEIEWLEADASIEQIRITVATSAHSHFPVCRGSLDEIVGVVHVKDLVKHALVSETIDLAQIARRALFVPEATPAIRLPERFGQAGTRFAFVVDEYGGVEGVITLNDVLEALIGEAATPETVRETLAVRRADGSWLFDGGMTTDQIKELTGLDGLPNEEGGEYSTLAGMVMSVLGRIPRTGELLQWKDWRFEVVDLDGPKIDKVLASRVPVPPTSGLP